MIQEQEEREKIGHKPPMYKTPEQLQLKIKEYFETGMRTRKVLVGRKDDKQLIDLPVPTITGLALFLGFESRQSFYDYEKKPAFTYTIKRARMLIECEYEEMMQHGNVVGAIFALKNLGWKDQAGIELTGKDGDPIKTQMVNIPPAPKTLAEWEKWVKDGKNE